MRRLFPFAAFYFAAGLFIGLSFAVKAAEAPLDASSAREIIPFDADWRFKLGDEAAAKSSSFDDSSWQKIELPHDWSIEGPLSPPPVGDQDTGFFIHGIGWYRKTFTLPADASTKKFVVEFDGAFMNSEVWINGEFLGRRPYGFIGFRYDLTDFLKKDGNPNVLAVRIDDSLEPSLRWYAGAGIYRHVRLIATNFTHFRLDGGIQISTPAATAQEAIVQTDAIIDAHFFTDEERQAWIKDNWHVKPVSREIVFKSTVLGPDGAEIVSTESKLTLESMHPGHRASQRLTVPTPHLWSEHTPDLYRIRCTLSLEGQVLDEVVTPFGIRRLDFDPDRGLLVNGQPTKLKGVCVHQDAGSFGNAVPIGVWAWRLARLKEMGCNAVRPSHHPFAPEFYDLCDQLGIYVFDEAFDEWTRDWPYNSTENTRGKSKYGYHLYFTQWHETDLRAMLRRDRNHPSVVLYSIGNEIPDQFNHEGWKLAKELVGICHEEDPTRPVTSACDQSYVASRNGFMDTLDLAGYNYIDRLYKEKTYAPERERFPHRLSLGTETSNRIHNWLGVRDHDYVIGEFIWTGIDYLGESKGLPRRGSSSGFLDLAGGKKPEFFRRAAYWRDDPLVQLSVLTGEKAANEWGLPPAHLHWNWTAGAPLTVRAVTNCDEVELFLNGRSLGRHPVSHDLYFSEWSVPFAPGTISAVAYRGGQKAATNELRTAGAQARIQIKSIVIPVPSELAVYELNLVDAAGITVPDAKNAVTIKVDGGARLIGLDTADLEYSGMFKVPTRDAYHGRLLATVERSLPIGEFHLSVSSPGLPTVELNSSAKGAGTD